MRIFGAHAGLSRSQCSCHPDLLHYVRAVVHILLSNQCCVQWPIKPFSWNKRSLLQPRCTFKAHRRLSPQLSWSRQQMSIACCAQALAKQPSIMKHCLASAGIPGSTAHIKFRAVTPIAMHHSCRVFPMHRDCEWPLEWVLLWCSCRCSRQTPLIMATEGNIGYDW